MVTLVQKLSHSSGAVESDAPADSPRGGNFSWSFVTRSSAAGPDLSRSRNTIHIDTGASTSQSPGPSDSACESRFSSSTLASGGSEQSSTVGDDSRSSTIGSPKSSISSPRFNSIRSLFSSGKRKGRKPVLLEKVPFGKRSEYVTLYVGARMGHSEKFVVSKRLLAHPLFQVLMKCSEDEFGEDYAVNSGVAIICDPALFLEVVRAVDDDMWSAENAQATAESDEREELGV